MASGFEVRRRDAMTATVTLRLPADIQASVVHVVGDFNDWDRGATPMHHDGDDLVATLQLAVGHRYRFRYLLDDDRWANDWRADDYVPNHFGGHDSVIDLTAEPDDPGASPDG